MSDLIGQTLLNRYRIDALAHVGSGVKHPMSRRK